MLSRLLPLFISLVTVADVDLFARLSSSQFCFLYSKFLLKSGMADTVNVFDQIMEYVCKREVNAENHFQKPTFVVKVARR